jgi:antagonist of KipI
MASIKIVNPGLFTLVEDSGRYGYQQYGVPVSGVMDTFSHRISNILVGNDESEAVLEVTMMGPHIEFSSQTVIAVTGGNLSPELNGVAIPMWESVLVQKGDRLTFRGLKSGCRSYIAFSGGINVPRVMESKSTYTRGNIGGYEGRALKSGDVLEIGPPAESLPKLSGRKVPREFIPVYPGTIELRVTMGPQDDHFTPEGIQTFLSGTYDVTNEFDRMGYRLAGEKITHVKGGDIISDGIAMGAVQVPGHGQPIIMLADRQTTGGYTKIANVIWADLPKIAQAKPGDKIRFSKVSVLKAQQLLREMEERVLSIRKACSAQRVVSARLLRLKIDGKCYEVKVEEIK